MEELGCSKTFDSAFPVLCYDSKTPTTDVFDFYRIMVQQLQSPLFHWDWWCAYTS